MTTLARANTKEAQLRRLIETAQAAGLTIHEIIVGPREMRLRTQPLGKSHRARGCCRPVAEGAAPCA